MTEPFIGEIVMLGCNYAPSGFAACAGQLTPISQNTALFSIAGTYFGGDGTTTFGLPDLRDRAALHAGQGPGLTQRELGEVGGVDAVTLLEGQLAAHSHAALASAGPGTADSPGGGVWAGSADAAYGGPADAVMAAQAIGPTGGGGPHNNLPPYLAITFCLALQGVYPPRG